jgi:tetratricopeptide (TPR) repeat protein
MREGRLAEVKTLFESLVDLPPETRLRVLAECCSTDEELRVFVERMLANYDRGMGSFLQPLQSLVHPASRLDSALSSPDSTALPTTFALGERVAERYRVERLLGQGGMGEVYEVWDDELAIPMALKTLGFGAAQERAIRRFKQEAFLARAVVHPNICRVYDLGCHTDADDAVWFLTMEVLRGETLRERLRSGGRFTPEEALPLVRQMAAGLGAAHQAGVVHGDFKSGNVMLVDSPEGEQAVITDFGLAQEVQDRPDDGLTSEDRPGIAGTPAYMAPEQVLGQSAGTAADIYALGVVLYEMVTGSLPFTGSTPWEAALRRLDEPPPSPREAVPTLEERWEQVILRCLSREPRGRFTRVEEVADALAGRAPAVSLDVMAAAVPRHRVPAELDVFVGRESELAQLGGRFANGARLVTLVGTAGMGKTRVAVRYGRRHLATWPGGVWFCDLTAARSLDGIVSAMSRSLGVELGRGDAVTQLAQAIAGRGQCLMILDNFEQVVEYARETVSAWLGAAMSARFLVTSRERLSLPGEEVQAVEPLEFETSLALFLERARRLRPGLRLEGPALAAAHEVVRLVEGMPLAIELAAARMRVMSAEELLAGMRHRFRLLTGGASLRHETLAAAIDGSWDLLRPWEMAALAQSSVFDGGFTLEAAESVIDLRAWPNAPWVVEVVQSLVDKSLLRLLIHESAQGTGVPETRVGMYASIHDYTCRKLAEEGSVPEGMSGAAAARSAEERHGAWYARYGTGDSIGLDREGGVVRRHALQRDLGNLMTACRRALARGNEKTAVASYRASWAALELGGQFRVAAELGQDVLGLGLGLEEKANVLGMLGHVEYHSGRMSEAHAHFEGALDIYHELGNRRSEGIIFDNLGLIHAQHGRMEEARGHYETALGIHRELGNRRSEGIVHDHLGTLHKNQGRMEEAWAHYEAALEIHREVGNRRSEGIVLDNLGNLHALQGRMEEARTHYEAALGIHRELGSRRSEGLALDHLGNLHYHQGRIEEARTHFEVALVIARELGDRRMESTSLNNVGCLHLNQGRMEEARPRLEAALAIARELGDRRTESLVLGNLGNLHSYQGRMEEARAHFEAGLPIARELRHRHLEGAFCVDLGALLLEQGRMETAKDYFEMALVIARELRNRRSECFALIDLADLSRQQGRMVKALGNSEAALAIARELGNRHLEGVALDGLGKQHLDQDRLEMARDALTSGEAALREVSAPAELANLLITRAELECRIGDAATAATTLSEAEVLAKAVGASADSGLGCKIAKLREGILLEASVRAEAVPRDR